MNSSDSSPEHLFEEELKKYAPICSQVKENIEAQKELMSEIQQQNDVFTAAFSLPEHKGKSPS